MNEFLLTQSISKGLTLLVLSTILFCCFCYLLYRLDKPIYYNGKPYFRTDYFLAMGFTEKEIIRAISLGVNVKESKRNILYLCEEDFNRLMTKEQANKKNKK
jgi:hypothetical protein